MKDFEVKRDKFSDFCDSLMTGVDVFNEGAGRAVNNFSEGVVRSGEFARNAVLHPIDASVEIAGQAADIGLMVWDGYNAIADAALGISSGGSKKRNEERGKVLGQGIENFNNLSDRDKSVRVVEFLYGGILDAALSGTVKNIAGLKVAGLMQEVKVQEVTEKAVRRVISDKHLQSINQGVKAYAGVENYIVTNSRQVYHDILSQVTSLAHDLQEGTASGSSVAVAFHKLSAGDRQEVLAGLQVLAEETAQKIGVDLGSWHARSPYRDVSKKLQSTLENKKTEHLLVGWGLSPQEVSKIPSANRQEINQRLDDYVAQYKHKKFTEALASMNEVFSCVGVVGDLLGNKALKSAPAVGKSMSKIFEGLSALRALPTGAGVMAMLSPMNLMATGALGLFSVFKRKRAPVQNNQGAQELMRELKNLSSQITQLRQEMSDEFKKTHKNQQMTFEAVVRGFDFLEQVVNQGFQEAKSLITGNFENVSKQLAALKTLAIEGFSDLNLDALKRSLSAIDRKFKEYLKSKEKGAVNFHIEGDFFEKHLEELRCWLIDTRNIQAKCKDRFLTGEKAVPSGSLALLEAADCDGIVQFLGADQEPHQQLGFFIGHAKKSLAKTEKGLVMGHHSFPSHAVNIDVWLCAVRAYQELFELAAVSNIPYEDAQSDLEAVIKLGEEIVGSLVDFNKNSKLILGGLLKDYVDCLSGLRVDILSKAHRLADLEIQKPVAGGLSLQERRADVHGASLDLGQSFIPHLNIPQEFFLAEQQGLGQFVFDGGRSSRHNDTRGGAGQVGAGIGAWQHSNKSRGVSAVFPWAVYEIDCYFQMNGQRILIAQASMTEHASDQFEGWSEHAAHVLHLEQYNKILSWINRNNPDFYTQLWRPQKLRFSSCFNGSDPAIDILKKLIREKAKEKLSTEALRKGFEGGSSSDILSDPDVKKRLKQLDVCVSLLNSFWSLSGLTDSPERKLFDFLSSQKIVEAFSNAAHPVSLDGLFGEWVDKLQALGRELARRIEFSQALSLGQSQINLDPKKSRHQFAMEAGFELIEVEGDGNCFFRSVAKLLNSMGHQNRSNWTHVEIRASAVNYFREHPELHVGFGEGMDFRTADAYANRMAQDGIWAVDNIIDATALTLGVQLVIVDYRENGDQHFANLNEGATPVLTLLRTGEELGAQHYAGLSPRDRGTSLVVVESDFRESENLQSLVFENPDQAVLLPSVAYAVIEQLSELHKLLSSQRYGVELAPEILPEPVSGVARRQESAVGSSIRGHGQFFQKAPEISFPVTDGAKNVYEEMFAQAMNKFQEGMDAFDEGSFERASQLLRAAQRRWEGSYQDFSTERRAKIDQLLPQVTQALESIRNANAEREVAGFVVM